MKFALKTSIAAVALLAAMPAAAQVAYVPASSGQGTLVHGTNVVQTGPDVIGNLGSGGPNIVHFTGNTTESSATTGESIMLQDGTGQSDVTGAFITLTEDKKDVYNIISGDIFLTGHAGFDYIEFGLTGLGNGGEVDFIITTTNGVYNLFDKVLGSGNTHYAFDAVAGNLITNVHYAAGGGTTGPSELTILKQVRLDIGTVRAVPEPATWAMMLLGFGGIGFSMRRRAKPVLAQVA